MEPPFSEAEEMRKNYPYFRTFVVSKMKEEFSRTLEPPAGGDLQRTAEEERALPLQAFIKEIEEGNAG